MVTPDVARNAVVDADRRILDFRIVQVGASAIELSLVRGLAPEAAQAAVSALARAMAKAGAAAPEIIIKSGVDVPLDRKLRRVRREWSPPASAR